MQMSWGIGEKKRNGILLKNLQTILLQGEIQFPLTKKGADRCRDPGTLRFGKGRKLQKPKKIRLRGKKGSEKMKCKK